MDMLFNCLFVTLKQKSLGQIESHSGHIDIMKEVLTCLRSGDGHEQHLQLLEGANYTLKDGICVYFLTTGSSPTWLVDFLNSKFTRLQFRLGSCDMANMKLYPEG